MASELLTPKEIAQELRLSISAVYAKVLAPNGDCPAIRLNPGPRAKRKIAGSIKVRREDLDAWILRHRTGPAAAEPSRRQRPSIADLPGADRYLQ
jgi:hypothetical protein